MALKLASDGFEVIVHGRDAGRGAATVRAIEEAGGHARFVAADLADADAVAQLAKDAADVDVLINNGGLSWFAPTAELDPTTFDALFASNVRSAYQLVAALSALSRAWAAESVPRAFASTLSRPDPSTPTAPARSGSSSWARPR